MAMVTRLQRAFTGQSAALTSAPRPASTNDAFDVVGITFHPELQVRWDDESAYGNDTSCARPGRIAMRPAHR